MQNQNFQLVVDGVPFDVKAEPFTFNEGVRYNVSYNGSPDFIFAWDESASQYVAIDHDSAVIPANVETEISLQLNRLS